MIRLKDELINFPPIDLDALSGKGKRFPENVCTAVALYNKAIERIKFNSSDIAIIELKKAVKVFPEFYDAILLLSLCYYAEDDKTKAINLLNSIRDEEERNKCFRYLDSVVGKNLSGKSMMRRTDNVMAKGPTHPGQRPVHARPNAGTRPAGSNANQGARKQTYQVQQILAKILNNPLVFRGIVFAIGFLIIIGLIMGVYTIYNVNSKASENDAKLVELESNYNSEKQKADKATAALKELKENDEELIEQYILPIILEKYTNMDTEYENIVKIIYLLDTSVLSNADSVNRINTIENEALLVFGEKTYANAQNDVIESKYVDAITKLENIIKYYPNYSKITAVMLELGKAYIAEDNVAAAKQVLTELTEYYGTSIQAIEAKELLDSLNA